VKKLASRNERLFGRLVLIYQMPKVGSQTIEATLRRCSFPHPIERFHSLSPAIARTIQQGLSSAKPEEDWKRDAGQQLAAIGSLRSCIRRRKLLRLCGFAVPKLEVITGVRELIGLMLASIFENYRYFAPNYQSLTIEKCREALLHPKTFKTIREWFDLELKSYVGLDVYQKEFPQALGYSIFEKPFARVLVYRFENFEILPSILSKFLGWSVPELASSNLGSSKDYSEQYRSVKEHLRLPADFVADLYGSRLMRHFYSEDERRQWLARWANRAVEQSPD
jgi:hypothetical protein